MKKMLIIFFLCCLFLNILTPIAAQDNILEVEKNNYPTYSKKSYRNDEPYGRLAKDEEAYSQTLKNISSQGKKTSYKKKLLVKGIQTFGKTLEYLESFKRNWEYPIKTVAKDLAAIQLDHNLNIVKMVAPLPTLDYYFLLKKHRIDLGEHYTKYRKEFELAFSFIDLMDGLGMVAGGGFLMDKNPQLASLLLAASINPLTKGSSGIYNYFAGNELERIDPIGEGLDLVNIKKPYSHMISDGMDIGFSIPAAKFSLIEMLPFFSKKDVGKIVSNSDDIIKKAIKNVDELSNGKTLTSPKSLGISQDTSELYAKLNKSKELIIEESAKITKKRTKGYKENLKDYIDVREKLKKEFKLSKVDMAKNILGEDFLFKKGDVLDYSKIPPERKHQPIALLVTPDFFDGKYPFYVIKELLARSFENHHIITDKGRYWGPEFENLLKDNEIYMSLEHWANKLYLPHSGKHLDKYHKLVYDLIEIIAIKNKGNTKGFIKELIKLRKFMAKNPAILVGEYGVDILRKFSF